MTRQNQINAGHALARRILDLCDAVQRDNYGREAVDVYDLREALGEFLGVRGDEDLRAELARCPVCGEVGVTACMDEDGGPLDVDHVGRPPFFPPGFDRAFPAGPRG